MKSITFREPHVLHNSQLHYERTPQFSAKIAFDPCIFLLENKNGNGKMAHKLTGSYIYCLEGFGAFGIWSDVK